MEYETKIEIKDLKYLFLRIKEKEKYLSVFHPYSYRLNTIKVLGSTFILHGKYIYLGLGIFLSPSLYHHIISWKNNVCVRDSNA